MTIGAATITLSAAGPRLDAGRALPIEAMVLGKSLADAAALLPRLFNLCKPAQTAAARLSLGLQSNGAEKELLADIIRDHVLKLCVILPRAFGMPPLPIPANPADLLGVNGLPPDADFAHWNSPAAALALRLARAFPAQIATCAPLPMPEKPLDFGAFENSPAGRQRAHPCLRAIEAQFGRGPLWRYAGMIADLEAAIKGAIASPVVIADGTAIVPAARGTYALRLSHAGGIVTGMARATPTDHLLHPNGALIQSLAAMPASYFALAPAVIALHDPCIPVTFREAHHA